jgi:SAM-dependent methyltransferase
MIRTSRWLSLAETWGRLRACRRCVGQLRAIAPSFPRSCQQRGLWRTARLAGAELLFDIVHGTDTTLEVSGSFPDASHPAHAGSNPVLFKELVRKLPTESSRTVFLDLGAGKGRGLILAIQAGFHAVIGVEVSAEFCAITQRNLAQYCRRDPRLQWSVACADAAEVAIPDNVNVVYMYNPFEAEVTQRVISRIVESIARQPRPVFVVYVHPRHADLFVRAGFVAVYRATPDGMILSGLS